MALTNRWPITFMLTAICLAGCNQATDEVASTVKESASDYVADPTKPTEQQGTDAANAANAAMSALQGMELSEAKETSRDAVEGELETPNDLASVPDTPTFESFITRLQQAAGPAEGLAIAQEAQQALPDDPRVLNMLLQMCVMTARSGETEKALEVVENLPQKETEPGVKMILLQLYQQKAQTLAEEKPAEALALMKKSTAIVREIGTDQPWAGDFIYDEAVMLADAGEAEASVATLREAFEFGFSQISRPMTDKAFAENADAQKLIEEFAIHIRERQRESIREEMAQTESFPFDFELTNTAGDPVSKTAYEGKVLIVDFWGTWCPPCRMEIPHFVELQENYPDDLAIVGLNYNEQGDTPEDQAKHISSFMTANEMNYQCALGSDEVMQQVPNLEGFPTTLFFDRSGKLRLRLVGYHPYEKLEAAVLELAAEDAAAEDAQATDKEKEEVAS